MNQQLINYIINLENQGYQENQIYLYLINNNYVQEKQIKQLKKEVENQKNTNIINQLNYYYNYYKQQNYSNDQIKNYFISQGYNNQIIQKIIPNSNTINHELGNKTIIKLTSVFILLILISFSGFFLVSNTINNKELLDLKITKIDNYIKPNSDLNFQFEIINMGTKKRYDIITKYQIKKDGIVLKEEMDSFAISTIENPIKSIYIPKTYEDGSYQLYIETKYSKNTIVKAQKEFIIDSKKQTIKLEEIKETTNKIDNNNNNNNNNSNNNNINNNIINNKNQLNPNNKDNQKQATTKENEQEKPKEIKNKIDCSKEKKPDDCYLENAKKEFNSNLCSNINQNTKQEECYNYFINLGQYNLCNKLQNSKSNPTCKQKEELDNLVSYYEDLNNKNKEKYKNITIPEDNNNQNNNTNDINNFLE
jgi:hypothetical protein